MKKGFINILELILVLIALFIAFGILFPGFMYKTNWDAAQILLVSRDVILTADRTGNLYSYSFDATQLYNFLNQTIPTDKTNLMGWSETGGTLKNRIVVACNCTENQVNDLYNWTTGLTINGRTIDVDVVRTNLDNINIPSDVLFIWGYRDLTPFRGSLLWYISQENGIVEMMDFPVNPEPIQQEIFGITQGGLGWGSPSADVIVKPATASNVTYQAYKIYLNGIKGQSPINPEFCKDSPNKKVIPADGDTSRVFAQGDDPANRDFCVIFNDRGVAKVAWVDDFTGLAYNSNHTKLFTSVLLSVSNKRATGVLSSTKIGYTTSYINVKNTDMFEVYGFNLGLGYPY